MGEREQRRIVPTRATLFIDDVYDITETGDVFRCTAPSGGEVYSFAFSPHTTLKAIHLLQRAYDDWSAANRDAQGIRTGRDHAASS